MNANHLPLALATGLLLTMTANSTAADLKPGKPFPGLVFPSIEDGSALSVNQFRGQKTLLHIFASW